MTWDPEYFADASTLVYIQIHYPDNTGFTALRVSLAKTGYSVWTVDEEVLTQRNRDGSDLVASLMLLSVDPNGNRVEYTYGPNVTISNLAPSYAALPGSSTQDTRRAWKIAVPVTVVVVLLALGVFALWSWSRRRRVCGLGLRGRTRDQKKASPTPNHGWPESKSHEVELTVCESWGHPQGKNVFREEVRRQELTRGF